jgi:hypothetical protein
MLEKMPYPLNRMVQQSPLMVCLGLPNLAKAISAAMLC